MTILSFRRRTAFIFLLSFLLALTLLSVVGSAIAPAHAQGDGQNDPAGRAYRGQALFVKRCVQCHGQQGQGDGPLAEQIPGPLPDFTAPDYAADMSPQDIFDVITNGRMDKMMPPWGQELSEEERWDLTSYVWSLHIPAQTINDAIALYESTCTQCHGSSGAGLTPDVPDLNNAKWLDVTDAQLAAAFTSHPHPAVGELSDDQQQLLALAARRFSLGFDQTQVTVEGLGDVDALVKNGGSGEPLANQPVRLIIFQQEQFAEIREGQTDDQGRTQFTGLPTGPTWAYVIETTYQDLTYHSEVGHFSPDSNMIELIASVYDPGASIDAVSISRAHWLIDISNPSFIDVGEVYAFSNSAKRVFTGEMNPGADKPEVIRIPLPENAIHISVEGETLGERFLLEGTTLIDTQPLPPGDTQIFLRYALPVENGQATLAHPLLYPTKMLNLLAPDIGVTVQAPDWQQEAPIQTQSGDFLNYTILNLPASSTPTAIISGISEELVQQQSETGDGAQQQIIDSSAAPGVSGSPKLPWIVSGLGLILLGGGLFIGWKKHARSLAQLPALRQEQKQALIQQIAALDDRFEAGNIPADSYYQQRNALKLQLIALLGEETPAEEETTEDGEATN